MRACIISEKLNGIARILESSLTSLEIVKANTNSLKTLANMLIIDTENTNIFQGLTVS